MKILQYTIIFLLLTSVFQTVAQNSKLTVTIDVAGDIKKDFKQDGRLYVFLTRNPNIEPKTQTWPNPVFRTDIVARNIKGWDAEALYVSSQIWMAGLVQPTGTCPMSRLANTSFRFCGIRTRKNPALMLPVTRMQISNQLT